MVRGCHALHKEIWHTLDLIGYGGTGLLERGEGMAFSIGEKFEGVKQFLREVKTELKKVTWPTRKDTLAGTAVVLVTVGVSAVFLFIVDYGLSTLIKWFLRGAAS
jgi:preprotein translocase subunit SecE